MNLPEMPLRNEHVRMLGLPLILRRFRMHFLALLLTALPVLAQSTISIGPQLPPIRREWQLAARPQPIVAVLRRYNPAEATITLAATIDGKEIERTVPIQMLSASDQTYIRRLTGFTAVEKSTVPITKSPEVVTLEPLAQSPGRLSLSKEEPRPCIEVHGILGEVRFLGRIGNDDRTFKMTDPVFQRAVEANTLPALIGASYVQSRPSGTLNIPVKVAGFPLLGQKSGTCYIAYYREWLYYYLGTRADRMPVIEGTEEFLNLLLITEPDLADLFDASRRKSARNFDANTILARRQAAQFREQITFLIANYFLGPETVADCAWAPISRHGGQDYDRTSRRTIEAQLGGIMQALLLGHMVIGRGEGHVMGIIGVDDDQLVISTWGREYKGTIKQLARADSRGPMLAPIDYRNYSIVARNANGRAVLPRLPRHELDGQRQTVLNAYARFVRGD